jgi:hypothetical protein
MVIAPSTPQKKESSGYDAAQLGQVRLTKRDASEAVMTGQREAIRAVQSFPRICPRMRQGLAASSLAQLPKLRTFIVDQRQLLTDLGSDPETNASRSIQTELFSPTP